MSISRAQINDFANYVGRHPALPEFERRVDARIYQEFLKSETEDERIKVGYLHDAFTAVMGEIKIVLDEMRATKAKEEEENAH